MVVISFFEFICVEGFGLSVFVCGNLFVDIFMFLFYVGGRGYFYNFL